jgi:hypothetical protein
VLCSLSTIPKGRITGLTIATIGWLAYSYVCVCCAAAQLSHLCTVSTMQETERMERFLAP